MNTFKKIFLLTLFSVFFLSAYSQFSTGTEILARINIDRNAEPNVTLDNDRESLDISVTGMEIGDEDDPLYVSGGSYWLPLYKYVYVDKGHDWVTLRCEGRGWQICKILWMDVINIYNTIRGLSVEAAEATLSNIFTDSEEQVANGVYQGSVSKKLAILGDKTNFILFQMNWNYDPTNAYNGQAEIIISKTDNLGF